MAHQEQRDFINSVKEILPGYFENTKVLEVGSLNINGTVRDFFTNCGYLGVDVGDGPGVDMVARGEDLEFDDETFDVTISTECFEHAQNWREILRNMVRMTKVGGLVVVTCAGPGRPEHGTTRSDIGSSPLTVGLGIEYYGNVSESDIAKTILDLPYPMTFMTHYNENACDTYMYGIRQ